MANNNYEPSMMDYYFDLNDYYYEKYKFSLTNPTNEQLLRFLVLFQNGKFFEGYGSETTLSPEVDNSGERVRVTTCLLNMEVIPPKNKLFVMGNRKFPIGVGFPKKNANSRHFPVLIENGYTLVIVPQKKHVFNLKNGKQKEVCERNVTRILNKTTYFDNPIYLQTILSSSSSFSFTNINNDEEINFKEHRYTETMLEQTNKPILMCINLVYISLTKLFTVGIAIYSVTIGSIELYENTSTFEERLLAIDDIIRLCQIYNPTHIIWCDGNTTLNQLKLVNPLIFESIEKLKNSKGQPIQQIKMSNLKSLYQINAQEEILKLVYASKQSFTTENQLSTLDYLDLKNNPEVRVALCYLIEYLYETNKSLFDLIKKPTWITTQHINLNQSNHLILEQNAIRELNIHELYQTIFARLLQTIMGKRILKQRLMIPSSNVNIIQQRYHLSSLFENHAENIEKNKLSNQRLLKTKTFLGLSVSECSLYASLFHLLTETNSTHTGKYDINLFFQQRNINYEIIKSDLLLQNFTIDMDYLHQRMNLKLLSVKHFKHLYLFLLNISMHAECYGLDKIKYDFFHHCNDLETVLTSFFNPLFLAKEKHNSSMYMYKYNLFETKNILSFLLNNNNDDHLLLNFLSSKEKTCNSSKLLESYFYGKTSGNEGEESNPEVIKSLLKYRSMKSSKLFAPYQKLNTITKEMDTISPFEKLKITENENIPLTSQINKIQIEGEDFAVKPGSTLTNKINELNKYKCNSRPSSLKKTQSSNEKKAKEENEKKNVNEDEDEDKVENASLIKSKYTNLSIILCEQYQHYFILHVLYELFTDVSSQLNENIIKKNWNQYNDSTTTSTKRKNYKKDYFEENKIDLKEHKHYGLIWIASKNVMEIFSTASEAQNLQMNCKIHNIISADKVELFLQTCYILFQNGSNPSDSDSGQEDDEDNNETDEIEEEEEEDANENDLDETKDKINILFIQKYIRQFYDYFLFYYDGSLDYLLEEKSRVKKSKKSLFSFDFFSNITRQDFSKLNNHNTAKQLKKTLDELETKQVSLGQKSNIRHNFPKIKSALLHNKFSILFYETKRFLMKVEKRLFNKLLFSFAQCYSNRIESISKFMAEIDIAHASAHSKVIYNYSKPIIQNNDKELSSWFSIKQLRHPLVERNLLNGSTYIANDFECSNDKPGLIICGINSSGKSCAMRSVGLALVLAQAGLYVPCSLMTYYPFQNILTRIMGNDSILENKSSFTVEVLECKTIVTRSTQNTFVMGDEICHGTEILSGTVLVASLLDHIVSKNTKCIIATHMRALESSCTHIDKIQFKHLFVEQRVDGSLYFDRTLKDGTGPDTYGLDVAESLGMPMEIILNARKKLAIMRGHPETLIGKQSHSNYLKGPQSKSHFINTQGICSLCQQEFAVEEDHIVPRDYANQNMSYLSYVINKNNLRKLCKKCHQQKSNNEKTLKRELGPAVYYKMDPNELKERLLSMESVSSIKEKEEQTKGLKRKQTQPVETTIAKKQKMAQNTLHKFF